LKPRRGSISLYGEDVAGLAPDTIARKGICLVPQGRRMFRTLTVRENLMVAAQRPKDGGSGWSIDRVFQLFPRLPDRQAQPAGSVPGGEQQMLAIGRALRGNPRVLLMDEPSEGLAPQLVAEVGRTIAQLKSEGQSIVLVEQNIKLTLDLADDIVIINTGRVVFRGTAGERRLDDAIVSQHLDVFYPAAQSTKIEERNGAAMATQWNKYEATAARRHGKPGREIRPKSTTIDIHSHVAIPQAAAFVKPHLDMSSIPLAHFANAET